MALTTAQQDFISRVDTLTKTLYSTYGELNALNALWYGATADYDTQITDPEIAEIASFNGVTVSVLNECMYIIGQLKGLIDDRLEPIAVMRR